MASAANRQTCGVSPGAIAVPSFAGIMRARHARLKQAQIPCYFAGFGGVSLKTLIGSSGQQAGSVCLIIRRLFGTLFIFWAMRCRLTCGLFEMMFACRMAESPGDFARLLLGHLRCLAHAGFVYLAGGARQADCRNGSAEVIEHRRGDAAHSQTVFFVINPVAALSSTRLGFATSADKHTSSKAHLSARPSRLEQTVAGHKIAR
jgi:hypothetical protein